MKNSDIWFERKFTFNHPVDLFPMVVERLRGAPTRLEEKLAGLNDSILRRSLPGGWSIQQQAGHLLILEDLWSGRLDDYLSGEKTLRAADINNEATHQTDFHSHPIGEIMKAFRTKRIALVDRLYQLTAKQADQVALHPRLNQPMRLMDAFYFVAEHDDHHLARMTDLILTKE